MKSTLTILKCQGENEKLTKKFVFATDRIIKHPAPQVQFFNFSEKQVSNLNGLFQLLTYLNTQPKLCIIRGQLKPNLPSKNQYRRKEGQHASVDEVDRPWVCIDIDDVTLTNPCDLTPSGLIEAARVVVAQVLPKELHDVSFVAQWSSSAFFNTQTGEVDSKKSKLHAWFWLDKEVCGKGLRDTLKSWGVKDTATTDTIQVHYTAAPIFDNLTPPISNDMRVMLVQGDRDVLPISAYNTPNLAEYDQEQDRIAAQKEQDRKDREVEFQAWCKQNATQAKSNKMKDIAQAIVDRAIGTILQAPKGQRGSTIFGQAKWLGAIASEPRNELSPHSTLAMLENAAISIMSDSHRDALVSVRNGWKQGEASPFLLTPPQAAATKKSKAAKKKEQKKEETAILNIYQRYVNLSASLPDKGYPTAPIYLPSIAKEDGLTAVCASLGTGKTEAAKKLCAQYGSVLWIAHRVALTRNTQDRLNTGSLSAFHLYLDSEGQLQQKHLIVCVDSIARVANTYDLVVIDEADQVLRSTCKRSANPKALDAIINKITYISRALQAAKQIVLLSADLDDNTMHAFSKMARKPVSSSIHHSWVHPESTWNFFADLALWRKTLEDAVAQDQRIFAFFASKAQLETTATWLKNVYPHKTIIAIHREAEDGDKETLDSVNTAWKDADMVFVTTSAGSGVSFDVKDHFDRVFVNGVNAPMDFPASEYLQGALRIRHPKSKVVEVYLSDSERELRSREDLETEAKKKEQYTLGTIVRFAQIDRLMGIEDSTANLVNDVYFSCMAEAEVRSAYALKWLLDALIERNIKITYTVDVIDPADGGLLKKQLQEAKIANEVKRIRQILDADDLSPEEASVFVGKEISRKEQIQQDKHEIAMFYSDHTDTFEAPEAPHETVVALDAAGALRKQIRTLVKASMFAQNRDFFSHLDCGDLQYDTSNPDVAVFPRARSARDARHHHGEARQMYLLLHILVVSYPTLRNLLSDWLGYEFPSSGKSVDELFDIYYQDTAKHGRFVTGGPSMKKDPEANLGVICRLFGVKRLCERSGKGSRVYTLDVHDTMITLNLGRFELQRWQNSIQAWKAPVQEVEVPVISTIERRVEQLQMTLDQTRKEKQDSRVAVAPPQEITDEDHHIANMANLSINQLKDSPYEAIRLIRMTYPDCTMDRMVSCYNRIYASV